MPPIKSQNQKNSTHTLSDDEVRQIFEERRWPGGKVKCPACGLSTKIDPQTRIGVAGYYRCSAARLHDDVNGGRKYTFTVRTGTILARSHLKLTTWLRAFDLLRRHPGPISDAEFARMLSINPRSAGRIISKIRELQHGREGKTANSGDDPNKFVWELFVEHSRAQEE